MFDFGNRKANQLEIAKDIEAALKAAKINFRRQDNASSAEIAAKNLDVTTSKAGDAVVLNIFSTNGIPAGAIVVSRGGPAVVEFKNALARLFSDAYCMTSVFLYDHEREVRTYYSMGTTRNLGIFDLTREQIKTQNDYPGLIEGVKTRCGFQDVISMSNNIEQLIGRFRPSLG